MNWIVIVDSRVVFSANSETLARAQAEELARQGGTATVAREVAVCAGETTTKWTP